MTKRDLELIKQRLPLSAATIKRNADAGDTGLRASDTKPDEGKPLERRLSRKDSRRVGPTGRIKIRFTIHSLHPADWDGFDIKHLQDMLVRAGILPDDNWSILQGGVISEKVHSKEEEKTVVEITPPPNQA